MEFLRGVRVNENTPFQFMLMLPVGLKNGVEEMASLNRTSFSQEIMAALEDKYLRVNAGGATGVDTRVLLWLGCASGIH
ncbi:hypothetical protein [Pelagimonas varians]|uniref:hypothetical protein n=1 Tax=Pelagimonas varians TaxID=696760 RepID=UPI0014732ECF|nr:hypothetical protein [Pelagimonas varians]